MSTEQLLRSAVTAKCPFHNFVYKQKGNILIRGDGNNCALEHSPRACDMECAGLAPDWEICTRFKGDEHAKRLRMMIATARVNPDIEKDGKPLIVGLRTWGLAVKKVTQKDK